MMMDSNPQPHLLNEQGTSLANSHPRKLSVGILTESFSQPRPKELTEENTISHRQANSVRDIKNMQGVLHADKLKQSESPEQETSPWFCSRSFHQRPPTPAQVYHVETTPTLDASEPITETHTRLHAAKNVSAIDVEKISFAALTSVPEENVEAPQITKAKTRSSENLRLKLWEVLGTVASPNPQHASEHDLSIEAENMTLFQKNEEERVPVVKPRQNSDTIETDSECPDLTAGRPMTRSLIRKKASGRLKASKMETAQSTYHNKAKQGINNHSFRKEGFPRRLPYAVSGGSLAFTGKICEKWSPGIKATIMCPDELENSGQNQPVKSRGNKGPALEKSELQGNGGKDDKEFHLGRDVGCIEPESETLEIDYNQVHLKDAAEHVRNIVYCPNILDNVEQAADQTLDNHCLTFGVEEPKESYVPDSPPSKRETPVVDYYPKSPLKTRSGGEDDDGPAKILSNKNGIKSFKSFLSSRSSYFESDSEQNSSGFAGRFENSPLTKPKPLVEEEPECRLSLSSSEDSDSDASKEGSPVKGFGKSELIFPEIPTVEKSGFVLHLNKKLHYEETVNASSISPNLFEKVLESGNNLQRQLDSDEGDGLASAISLFALALERVKSKMKSMVRKRSAEILRSVAEGIQLQLQTAESQIQADIIGLGSTNKSKRKLFDRRYGELQGQLNVIQARFKDEVNCHRQDCISLVEGLDAHHMELRQTVEKQSVSHRKLLLQAEEAIETKLNDAQRRITGIHELAREKMFQLTSDLANCL